MSHSEFGRGATGIHTVEGNQAGARAAKLTQKREQDQKEYEAKKVCLLLPGIVMYVIDLPPSRSPHSPPSLPPSLPPTQHKQRKIQDDSQRAMGGIDQKFSSIQQTAFSLDFVGLKTKEELLNLKGAAEEEAARQKVVVEEEARRREKEEEEKRKLKQTKVARLSFAMGGDDDDEEDEDEGEDNGGRSSRPTKKNDTTSSSSSSSISVFKKKKALRNPEAETSFLRDPEAEKEQALLRENLKREWLAEQERVKEEMLEVTYSYWDGSGHRRVLKCKKGITIAKFLEMVKSQVAAEFTDLRGVTSDELMYIKEDLIIPHNYSFYDLILTKARGKSGPLFHFDVHDDVRLTMDARVEKDESHPGKVVERRWYERNKHIFPASRWEIYDPKVQRGGYTVHGVEVQEKKE